MSETVKSDCDKEKRILLPQDFDQIAEHSKPGNYIGFIYADGNRMGETIKRMEETFQAANSTAIPKEPIFRIYGPEKGGET